MDESPAPSVVLVVTSTSGSYDDAVTVPVLATHDRGLAERRISGLRRSSALEALALANAVPDHTAWAAANPGPAAPQAPRFDKARQGEKDYLRSHQKAMEEYRNLSRAFHGSPEFAAYVEASGAALDGFVRARRAEAEALPDAEIDFALATETYAIHEVPLV